MSDVAQLLYSRTDVRRRVRQLGRAISEDYRGRAPVLICILKGATMFLADLVRDVDVPLSVDFMSISPYEEGSGTGIVRIVKDLDQDIGGRDVLIVEDIIDTGLTLTYLMSVLRSRGPVSMEVCTLLDKSVRRIVPLDIRYRGFDCPDRFVVGYGLDFQERYRNLPFIMAVDDLDSLSANPDLLLPNLTGRKLKPAGGSGGQLADREHGGLAGA